MQIKHNEPLAVKEVTPCEKQKLCRKTFAWEVFSILHFSPLEEKNEILNLHRMDPPPFMEGMPRPHSLRIENGKKEVWQPLIRQRDLRWSTLWFIWDMDDALVQVSCGPTLSTQHNDADGRSYWNFQKRCLDQHPCTLVVQLFRIYIKDVRNSRG